MTDLQKKLTLLQRTDILLKILRDKNLDDLFHEFSPLQMKDLRDFLEKELLYLSHLKDKEPLPLAVVRNRYEPVAEYYRKQDCNEPYESCIDESCHVSSPVCFSMKMSLQIRTLIDSLRPYIRENRENGTSQS